MKILLLLLNTFRMNCCDIYTYILTTSLNDEMNE